MKQLDVKKQVQLPFSSCMELVFSGIRFRLFRAGVTVVIIALAVAFLMTMLTESLVSRRMADAVDNRTAPRRELVYWVGRLSAPLSETLLSSQLTDTHLGDMRYEEFKQWGSLDDKTLERLIQVARRQAIYLAFFERLSEAEIRPLLGRSRGETILTALQTPQARELFRREYPKLGKMLPERSGDLASDQGDDLKAFEQFLDDWAQTQALRRKIMAGHARAVTAATALLEGRSANDLLASTNEKELQQLHAAGFRIDPKRLPSIRYQAQLRSDSSQVLGMLAVAKFKHQLARRKGLAPGKVTESVLLDEIQSASGAEWFLATCKELQDAGTETPSSMLSVDRVREIAKQRLDEAGLADIEAVVTTNEDGGGFLGFSGRTTWLILVSLLVCAVGIANAMLMSVTERFQEIATMKCLGATDRLIMISFVMESVMQGFAGGVVGAVAGLLLGMLRSLITFGWMALGELPGLQLLAIAGMSLVVGMILSALAAMYPARIAAKLAPMEAMRIE